MNELIKTVKSLMPETHITEQLIESILRRLESFGYDLGEGADAYALAFTIQKVEIHIMNSCNVSSIPEGLYNVLIDRVCGEFLFSKKQTGQLNIEGLDLTGVVASISEGDTSVSFVPDVNDEERFNQLVKVLMTMGEGDMVCYRKLNW